MGRPTNGNTHQPLNIFTNHAKLGARNGLNKNRANTTKSSSSSVTKPSSDFKKGCLFLTMTIVLWFYALIRMNAILDISSSPSSLLNSNHLSFAGDIRHNLQAKKQEFLRRKEFEFPVFPHNINKTTEYETILHPGHVALQEESNFNLKEIPTLSVPKFWYPQGGRNRTAPNDKLMTSEQALSFGSKVNVDGVEMETIYASIASYRDYQCPTTIESMFLRAKYPERLRVAVVDQYVPNVDQRCIDPVIPCSTDPDQVLCKYASQLSSYDMDAKLGVGPVFARHIGHRMYRGEYFAMQIDAHVTFVRNWDVDIIQQWRSAKNHMAIISVYLSDVTNSVNETTGARKRFARPIMCDTDFEGQGVRYLRHGQQPEGKPMIHNVPTIHPFWAAGFSFAPGHFVINVPYDQHLPMIFQGEEINIGIRGFTFGYDYYTPEFSVCYHMYAIGENKKKRQKVKLFWENANLYRGTAKKAKNRLVSQIHMQPYNKPLEYNREDEALYGIGKVRTPELFLDVFGIHVNNMTVEHNLCSFVGQPMQKLFLKAMRKDKMGLDYDKITFRYRNKQPNNKNLWWQDKDHQKK